ncbi:uncharacterized protein BXZ73DRAFT_98691 [Epithele typhae]|uniref:uncharacterized protein n=1 Tax=Epithele typhae TaxID=378194 RepID=UPI002007E3B9|nr:uncharacterized protein BXZ73DRAFT_98691 [Epithele typhae]KAH9940858.1 hypothetical protein BXZ73DRAFT_98691 [Epithele typhae]
MTTTLTTASSLPLAELRDFFDRLAAGDYRGLAKELRITPANPLYTPKTPSQASTASRDANHPPSTTHDASLRLPPDASFASPNTSFASPNASSQSNPDVSFRFKPSAERIQRAVALVRGENPDPTADPKGRGAAADEAFDFTFRMMIHELYSLAGFRALADDVVRASRARFRPLALQGGARRESLSFVFAARAGRGTEGAPSGVTATAVSRVAGRPGFTATEEDEAGLEDSEAAEAGCDPAPEAGARSESESFGFGSSAGLGSPESALSSVGLPRTPGGWEMEDEARATKKRITGRRLSVVDPFDDDERRGLRRTWEYDTKAVASADGWLDESFEFAPQAASPMRTGPAREDGSGMDVLSTPGGTLYYCDTLITLSTTTY